MDNYSGCFEESGKIPGSFAISWEQRKLGNMMDVTSVKRIHQSDWTDSGVRFLRARDIVAESKNEEVSEPIFISQEKYDEYSAVSGKVEKGDLLVTGVGTIGVPMLINSEEPLYFKDGNIIWFKNKNAIDGRFFYHSFKGLNIQKFIKESAGTGTVGTYTIENGKKTPINLPLQKEEQEKIGEYFSNLDNLIALHQRKQCILYIMEKLLCGKSKQLEKSISWEQRKLENILSLENGFAFQSEYFVEEKTGYVVATPGNVSVEGGFICEGGKNYSVSAPFNERFIFKSGDIFVTMTDLTPTANTLGKPAIVPDNGIIYLHNQRLGKLVDYNCNKKFLFALLCTDKYHSQIVKTASGTTVRHSSPDKILSYETFVPKFEEQKMIGKFFSNLDHFIALHQRKP